MIEETVIVTRYANGRAWLKTKPAGGCQACQQQTHCGTSALANGLPQREFELDCPIWVQPGDQVRVSIDNSELLLASLLAYMLPMVVMLSMVTGCYILWPQLTDSLPIVAFTSLLLGCWLSHYWQRRYRRPKHFQPCIVEKC